MSFDISNVLDKWHYQPGQICVRSFKGKDGAEKIQLRIDLGILQLNADGRPDGKRPFGHESLLDYFNQKLNRHRESSEGAETGFKLSEEDCSKLHQEAIQYHHRYICLLELGDFSRVLRDTSRNLALFDLVQTHAASSEASWALQQFRPQLILMQTRARGTMALKEMKFSEAIEAIEEGMESIRAFFHAQSRQELIGQNTELASLESWLTEVRSRRPLSRREQLERALEDAVRAEDYERAARMRDALRRIQEPDAD